MTDKTLIARLLEDPQSLKDRIQRKVAGLGLHESLIDLPEAEQKNASVVLFVLSLCRGGRNSGPAEPCIILNKRSSQVRQRGDLCCPGGGISWRSDRWLGQILGLPGSPLRRSPWRQREKASPALLNIFLAAGLREAWEEMRLNPLRFSFLGLLPQQQLIMFDRVIYPMVGWGSPQRLTPNWEVERIVRVPLRKLLDPQRYGRFRPLVAAPGGNGNGDQQLLRHYDFPCYIHHDESGSEMLWGATYRITQDFLQLVFGFTPPDIEDLPLARRNLDENYLNGSRWNPRSAERDDNADW
jgi:hypothetical protein